MLPSKYYRLVNNCWFQDISNIVSSFSNIFLVLKYFSLRSYSNAKYCPYNFPPFRVFLSTEYFPSRLFLPKFIPISWIFKFGIYVWYSCNVFQFIICFLLFICAFLFELSGILLFQYEVLSICLNQNIFSHLFFFRVWFWYFICYFTWFFEFGIYVWYICLVYEFGISVWYFSLIFVIVIWGC